MSKITEERFKDILLSLEIDYEQISILINHPEIKSLFACEEIVNNTPSHICESASLGGLRGSCPSCGSTVYTQDVKSSCAMCGCEIIWPTEPPAPVAEIIKTCDMAAEGSKDFSCETTFKKNDDGTNTIVKTELFDVIKYEFGGNGGLFDCPECVTDCPHGQLAEGENGNIVKVGSNLCQDKMPLLLKGCKHFAGHEVEGRSIRCKHRVNVGGEG